MRQAHQKLREFQLQRLPPEVREKLTKVDWRQRAERFSKMVVVGLVPLLVATPCFALLRALFRGKGSFHGDVFIVGASLIPPAVGCLAVGWVGLDQTTPVTIVMLFALALTTLMLYSGFTTIQRIPAQAATLAVPTIVMACIYASYQMMLRMVES